MCNYCGALIINISARLEGLLSILALMLHHSIRLPDPTGNINVCNAKCRAR